MIVQFLTILFYSLRTLWRTTFPAIWTYKISTYYNKVLNLIRLSYIFSLLLDSHWCKHIRFQSVNKLLLLLLIKYFVSTLPLDIKSSSNQPAFHWDSQNAQIPKASRNHKRKYQTTPHCQHMRNFLLWNCEIPCLVLYAPNGQWIKYSKHHWFCWSKRNGTASYSH